jgi:hypothetical protein
MADLPPLAGLLDRASHVFSLAQQLGECLKREHVGGEFKFHAREPNAWRRHRPAFEEYSNAVLALKDVIQSPPAGFAPVAQALLEALRVAKQIHEVMQTSEGRDWSSFLEYWPNLLSVAAKGRAAFRDLEETSRRQDPFAFLDQPPAGTTNGIDTTPTTPKPPPPLIEAAARAIPSVLASVPPLHDGAIELVASHLCRQLQDANHSLAAAQWAVHEAIQAGRLKAGRIEVDLPSFGQQVGRRAMFGLPDTRRMEFSGGGKSTVAIPQGKPAPFDTFKVVATPALWQWWRSLDAVGDAEKPAPAEAGHPADTSEGRHAKPAASSTDSRKPRAKRGMEPSGATVKLIAALTKHHQYADDSCLNAEPVNNNELARAAGVSPSTTSMFFKRQFGGHVKYRAICRDVGKLAASLKLLNNEFAPHDLFGRRPPDEDDRDE